ncbi:MAG: hypothetical protein ACD_51C00224G0006 [uncultured bacterium]|nr:MAG: hypothetical protein ACD_51C00224G0006 [uncultured bacterium]OGJ48645.1 MAG: hypothetical protein A2344_05090 [Candidatus Peregrinibacteria bacterium RIFOXYB12_FULL_41_12]OGJ48736.1 MAG: hypothetical protein A2244_03515 [Candidatus Peregrinibacteria bacterium RIFOXYA2_FULL_41_18]OGJ52810.1 MAG: hypothetical protein A2448_01255 [Candidatus Peregrinibacteria bacterium RIFOXYC2_FULL_41_22]OGJ52960.1 MAG: hypothetical protein A2336_05595 [Candidatus Peregrinibacteria bacterium RIFOXYB2_FULL
MKKTKIAAMAITIGLAISIPLALAADAWPASSTGIEINGGSVAEPSGSTIYGGQLWVVSDNGYVWSMNLDGTNKSSTYIGGDLEGITSKGSYLYVMYEYPQAVAEFNPTTKTLTGNTWNLASYISCPTTNLCLEAIVYDSTNDNFLLGHQETGYTYVLKLGASGSVTSVGSFAPLNGYTDLAGMYIQDGTLYQIWDGSDRIALGTYNPTTLAYTEIHHYTLAGDNQEGISLNGTTIYIMEDDGHIYYYTGFPTVSSNTTTVVEPEPTPDYSTISSYVLNTRKGTLVVTYTSGDAQTITFTAGARALVSKSTDGTELYLLITNVMQTYENGVLADTVTFGR